MKKLSSSPRSDKDSPRFVSPIPLLYPEFLQRLFATLDSRPLCEILDSQYVEGCGEFLEPIFNRLVTVSTEDLQEAIRKEIEVLFDNREFIEHLCKVFASQMEKSIELYRPSEPEFEGDLNIQISDLRLSANARKACARKSCSRLGHLTKMTLSEFMSGQQGVGKVTFNQIIEKLEWYGLDFMPEPVDTQS